MKKKVSWLLAAAAAALLFIFTPFRSSDVAELIPVEILVISKENNQLVVDGGEVQGRGATWTEAWQDLKQGAPGKVFLGTAEYVVLVGGAANQLDIVAESDLLRPAARVCLCLGEAPEVEKAAKFLTTKEGGVTLQMVCAARLQHREPDLPVLVNTKGGLRLYGT